MLDKIPQVFISYSWTSEVYKQKIKEIAERLMHDGIMVKLDVWDLKDGQDKYVYMEQCVTNPEIDRVLIFSDKIYAEKANGKVGGVGDETTIITSEIYGKSDQQKFIPIIMERDEGGEAYLPAYLRSLMYKDFTSDDFEKEYESLVRTIYDEPLERKPELGMRPSWLDTEPSKLFPVKEAVRNGSLSSTVALNNFSVQEFIDVYIDALKQFHKVSYDNNQEYLDDFFAMKEYRDSFLDYLKVASRRSDFGAYMADIFEKMYNTLCNAKSFNPTCISCNENEFDIFKLHIWELFVCTVTFMLHNELYDSIHDLLYHSYFLRNSYLDGRIEPTSYEAFRFHSEMIEEIIKPDLADGLNRKYTLTGHYIVTKREYYPIYTGTAMANADLFLYQVYKGMNLDELTWRFGWFPQLYAYADKYTSIWKKLVSVRFCKKIMPVFGVSNLDDLKIRLSYCVQDKDMRYSAGGVGAAPAILSFIKLEEIGTLP